MSTRTYPNEKFNKARAFMLDHPEISAGLVNWRKMKWRTLYAAMQVRGVLWDNARHEWYCPKKGSTISKAVMKVSPPAEVNGIKTVLVRIIADNGTINEALAELLDLANASNLLLVRNSGLINTRDGRSKRVYLKFLFDKTPTKP